MHGAFRKLPGEMPKNRLKHQLFAWHAACVIQRGTTPNDPNDKFGRT